MPIPYDWVWAFRPATLALLAGQSPYTITSEKFYNAPWALFPLIPIALLPDMLGCAVMVVLCVVAFGLAAYRLGASHVAMIAFVLSPFVMRGIWNGNIDWMPLLGVTLSPWLGLFFVAVKPQTCGLVAIYWLYEAWKARRILKTFAPVSAATLLSFVLYGLWPLRAATEVAQNNIFWPMSLVASIVLLIVALSKRDARFAAAASPMASPYAHQFSFASVLILLLRYKWVMVAATVILWIIEVSK